MRGEKITDSDTDVETVELVLDPRLSAATNDPLYTDELMQKVLCEKVPHAAFSTKYR